MKVIHGLENIPPSKVKRVVTIGFFDGVHKGHQVVISRAVDEARKLKAESTVLTFEPHPLEIVKPGSRPPILTSTSAKAELVEALGVDLFLVVRFTKKLAELEPNQFVDQILLGNLRAAAVVVGENFTFGREKKGDVDFLTTYGHRKGFTVISVPSLAVGGQVVSSTVVRALLSHGDLKGVTAMQGRYPKVSARVIKGRGEGTTLGFSTANLEIGRQSALPAHGVYAGYVWLDGLARACAIYLGTGPTFNLQEPRLEVHVFDFEGNLYGRWVEVEFREKIRDEKTFPDRGALAEQIKRDVAKARSLLSKVG